MAKRAENEVEKLRISAVGRPQVKRFIKKVNLLDL